jgi:hypothetical protein
VSGPWTSRYFNVLLKGAGKLFRLDAARGSYDYAGVFAFLRDGVCLTDQVLRQLKGPEIRMTLAVVFRYFFYYDRPENTAGFLAQVAKSLDGIGVGCGFGWCLVFGGGGFLLFYQHQLTIF